MAKTRLSQCNYVTRGYAQVEPNHLSARRTGQIYAQLPAASDIAVLENGQFVKYDAANGLVNFTGAGEWMLVFNEVKLYEDFKTEEDFAMLKENYGAYIYNAGGTAMPANTAMVPRCFKTNVGDIFTTNALCYGKSGDAALAVGVKFAPDADNKGLLTKADTSASAGDETHSKVIALASADIVWQVAKVYIMPDGQAGVKLVRIK